MRSKIYLTLSALFAFLAISSTDKFQVVDHSPCINRGFNYCHDRVKNSICSKFTNKCFCQSNFVAVREGESIICKPLLTDLKCAMDQDCNDVTNSVCHPGAGECTCPSETFFVPESHSCESEYTSNSETCRQCTNVGGRCYIQSSNFSIIKRNFKKNRKLCACPGITIFNENPKQYKTNLKQCNKIWVDIGQICDNITMICRPLRSQCLMNEVIGYGICQCNKHHWPVFQRHLKFHECYIEYFLMGNLDGNCNQCKQMNGICVGINEDSSSTSCICPISRKQIGYESISRNPTEIISALKCITTNEMIDVKCDMQKLMVCVQISEKEFPILANNIRKNLSKVFFSDRIKTDIESNFNDIPTEIDSQCYFFPTNNAFQADIEFCQTLIFDRAIGKFPCGVNMLQHTNGYFYSGYIEIWNDIYIPNLLFDKVFDISCKFSGRQELETVSQVIDRSWPYSSYQSRSREFQSKSDFVSFSLVDINNLENNIFNLSPIRLQANINRNTTFYKYISADLCWTQNQINGHQTERQIIIFKGCANKNNGFTTNFLPIYDFPALTSAFFKLPPSHNNQKILFKCVFRLCKNQFWCKTNYDCSGNFDRIYILEPPPQSAQDIIYIPKSVIITVNQEKQLQADSRLKNSLSECIHFWCVSRSKLLSIFIILGGFILLSLMTLILFCYRQKCVHFINHCDPISSRQTTFKSFNAQQYINSVSSSSHIPNSYSTYMLIPVGPRSHCCQSQKLMFNRSHALEPQCFINSSMSNSRSDSEIAKDQIPICPYCYQNTSVTRNSDDHEL